MTEDLILSHSLCPGDVVLCTAALRDLHRTYPGRFRTAVQMPCPEIWWHNPNVTPLNQLRNPRHIQWGWSAAQSNERYRHLIQIWADDLAAKLEMPIQMTDIRGDIYLTRAERETPASALTGESGPYWIIMAGSKSDAGTKAWPSSYYQSVVNALAGRVRFVQCGRAERDHHHPPLSGVCNMIGKTDCRQFIRLIHHAAGVLCPITFAMHLAAAVPVPAGKGLRPCVVVAGGREPPHMIQYPGHTILHSVGKLPCSAFGSCWKDHVPPRRTREDCHAPTVVAGHHVSTCMSRITPEEVVRAIESYG